MYVSRHVTHPQPFDGISKKSLALLWIVAFEKSVIVVIFCTAIADYHIYFVYTTMQKNIAVANNASEVFLYITMRVK